MASSLTVWKFPTVEGAGEALTKLESLSKQQLVTIEDAAVVYWETGKKKPKTQQAQSLTGAGALGGAFWGMLFGLLFFMPFFGLAVGAAMGALIGHYSDYGIDDKFIKEVQSEVTEGTSALFLLTHDSTVDKVEAAFEGTQMELIRSNLSTEQEAKLHEDFAG
jgi:uncharacterized membrane protein